MTDNVVGSAAFELRATKEKIPQDLEDARRVILESAKKTEDELAGVVGSGTEKGSKKAAAALKEPQAAGIEAGTAIRDSMRKAGEEIGEAVAKGAAKAKAELEQVAQKAREVQQVKLPTPTIPTAATHTLTTNPVNGVQSWAPNDLAGPRSLRDGGTPELKQTAIDAKEASEAISEIAPASDMASGGLGGLSKGALLTSAGIGALIGGAILVTKVLWEMGRAAMQSAGEISDSAKSIGVSTDTLQEFRYVATKLGEDAGAADQALGSFADKLAAAGSGLSKEAVKDFAALRITPEQIKSFKSTEDALDLVIDRIGDLKSETDRVAIAERLGLGPLAGALKGGADEVANLRDEAQRLGVVMDADLVKRGAEAQTQYETLSRVIDVQLKSAFVDLAPAIVTAIGLIAQLATALGDALDQWRDLDAKTGRGLRTERANLIAERDALVASNTTADGRVRGFGDQRVTIVPGQGERYSDARPAGTGFGMSFTGVVANLTGNQRQSVLASERFDNINSRISRIDAEVAERSTANTPTSRRDTLGGNNLVLPPPRQRGNRTEEMEARRAERVEAEINRLRARMLGIADEELLTVQERYDLEKAQVAAERAAEATQLASRKARKDITEEEFNQLTLVNSQTAALEDRVAADILARDLSDERLAKERVLTDLTADLLSLQSGAARTAGERREIELRLLEMAQKRAREELLNDKDFRKLSPDQQAAAVAEQDQVFGWQVNAVNRSTMSPLEAWRDESLSTAEQINEAYENVAANGLDALNSGIVDAIMNSKSLGETFHNVANQIIADLIAIGVRQQFTEPLANFLFGNGKSKGSGGGNLLSSIGSWFGKLPIPGFASGVNNFSGGLAYVHQGEVLANLAPGTDVIPAHALGGGGTTNVFQGNLMTPEFWARIQNGDRGAAQYGRTNGAMDGAKIVAGSAERQQRQTRMYKK